MTEQDQCVFTNAERKHEIVNVIKKELGGALDDYFSKNPFMIDAKQHFKDHEMAYELRDHIEEYRDNHEWTTSVRRDLKVVKGGFLKKIGQILALLFVGGLSWKYLGKFFFSGGGAG